MNANLSVLITSLPFPAAEALGEIARQGFAHVDLIGKAERSDEERSALADSGLIVDCVALGRDLPAHCALDAADLPSRQRAVEAVERQIAEASQVGARVAYLVPCKTASSLPAFADACKALATYARRRMISLCIEHFPGSALPTATGTLDWLRTNALDELNLLLDSGHCLISKEDPVQVIADAGGRLGYVQLDDNDGVGDLHWSLLTGALSEAMLKALLRELKKTGYPNGVALELNGNLAEPVRNLTDSKRIVERVWAEV